MTTLGRPDVTDIDLSGTFHEEVILARWAAESREPVPIDCPEQRPNNRKSRSDRR